MKTLLFNVLSKPDKPALGYGDTVTITEQSVEIWRDKGSTCPNPYKINSQNLPVPWSLLYGWVAPCQTTIECIDHYKYGKCLLINGGKELKSRVPNPNHGGRLVLSELFVHSGAFKSINKNWRASRGCLTMHPDVWTKFIVLFEVGETGILIIK